MISMERHRKRSPERDIVFGIQDRKNFVATTTAALIAAGLAAGGSVIGGKLASSQSKEQKAALTAQDELARQQTANAKQGATLSSTYSGMAAPALTNSLNYWQTLLNGDRTALSTALGPEIEQYKSGTASALNNLSEFAPRGGARTSTIGELPFTQARTIGDMFSSVRPAAAAAVSGAGTNLASLGLNALGNSTSAGSSASSDYLAQLAYLNQQKNNAFNVSAGIGKGLYSWAKGVDWGNVFNRNGGGVNLPTGNDGTGAGPIG